MNSETVLDNTERGCGHLQRKQAYIRADKNGLGILPPFVEFKEYIPHLEYQRFRGWKKFPGIQFELAAGVETVARGYTDDSLERLVSAGYYESVDEVPEQEISRHLDRLFDDEETTHAGEMDSASAHDLLMWAGKKHYPEPEDFIDECIERGMNKAIPTSQSNSPPDIYPGRTRVFILHPRAIEAPDEHEEEYYTGIIGYSYVTRVVWTEPADDKIPQYVKNYVSEGKIDDIVDIGPEIPAEAADEKQQSIEQFEV